MREVRHRPFLFGINELQANNTSPDIHDNLGIHYNSALELELQQGFGKVQTLILLFHNATQIFTIKKDFLCLYKPTIHGDFLSSPVFHGIYHGNIKVFYHEQNF